MDEDIRLMMQGFQAVCGERDLLEIKLSSLEKEKDTLSESYEDIRQQLSESKARIERLEKALKGIRSVDLDISLGQIVGSEHYEKAWLDCHEIATEALSEGERKI